MIKSILSLITMFSLISTSFAQADCPQGQVFNTTLNRCVLKQSTVDQKTEAMECEGLSGSALQKCVEENVNNQANENELGEGKDPKKNLIIPGIVAFTAAYALFMKKDAIKGCGSVSTWLMLGAGTATFLGEILARKKYKDKLKDAQNEYKEMREEIENGDSMENLTRMNVAAFDFQIRQEEARKSAHKARKDTYNIAFGLYTSATVAAIVEQFKFGGADSTCNLKKQGEGGEREMAQGESRIDIETPDGTTIEGTPQSFEYDPLVRACSNDIYNGATDAQKVSFTDMQTENLPGMSECMSNPSGFLSENNPYRETGIASFNSGVGSGSENMIVRGMRTPWVRAALSGVLAGHSKVTSKRAGDLADESQKRIDGLTELRNDFVATGGAGFEQCTASDRKSPSKPFCFCYNEKGQQDQAKKENEVCLNVWKSSDFNLIAGRYGKNEGESSQGFKGCVKRNGIVDPGCSCRNEKDAESGSACTNISGTLSLGGLKGLTGLPGMMNDTAKFTNGRISTGQLASNTDVDNLVKQIDLKKAQLMKNPKYAPTLKKINALEKKMGRQISSSFSKGLNNGSIVNPLGGGLGAGGSEDIDKDNILSQTKEDIKALDQSFSKMASTGFKKKKKGFNFDLGGGSAKGGIEIDNSTDTVMKKKFAYKTINQNPDTNIFQIISVRYQRSGFRRLFDDEGISQADEANDITIHGEN